MAHTVCVSYMYATQGAIIFTRAYRYCVPVSRTCKQYRNARVDIVLHLRSGITLTVTEALVLRPLLEDRGRITESIRIPVPVDRMKPDSRLTCA